MKEAFLSCNGQSHRSIVDRYYCAALSSGFSNTPSQEVRLLLINTEPAPMSDDEEASLGVSDGDISSADLSDGERGGAKEIASGGLSPPELGDSPRLLSGYSQTYIVRKRETWRDQGRNRQVRVCACLEDLSGCVRFSVLEKKRFHSSHAPLAPVVRLLWTVQGGLIVWRGVLYK